MCIEGVKDDTENKGGELVEIVIEDVMNEIIGSTDGDSDKDGGDNDKDSKKILDYQIVFQIAYFTSSIIPTSLGLSKSDSGVIPINTGLVIVYIAIGMLSQLSIYNRLQILKSSGISNILLCGLELIRRIIVLVFSFVVYMEEINTFIVVGIVLFIISSLLLLFEYVQKVYSNKKNYVEWK
jgi:hypothetical protein